MRALRTMLGVVLILIGVPALALAVAGWSAQQHAGPAGSYSAPLGAVRSAGYAVTVPDVAEVLDRHPGSAILGSDRVRVTIRSASVPVVLFLVPTADLDRYLDGVARTELAGVGFAAGPQPVDLIDFTGTVAPAPLVGQSFWPRAPSGQTLEWDRATDTHTSIMLARADGRPGFTASLAATVYPTWLGSATWLALLVAAVALAAASAVLLWRGADEGVSRDQLIEFADLVAVRLAGDRPAGLPTTRRRPPALDRTAPNRGSLDRPVPDRGSLDRPAPDRRRPWDLGAGGGVADEAAPRHRRDLTGELVQVPSVRPPESPYVHSAT